MDNPPSSKIQTRSEKPKIGRFSAGLHIFVLVSFAVAQPLFDRLSRNLVYLQDQGIGRAAILLLVLILCCLVPIFIVAIELAIACISDRIRKHVHAVFVFLLVTAGLCPVLPRIVILPGIALVVMALILGALGAIAYVRFVNARLLVTLASPAVLVFPSVFLFFSPVTALVLPKPDAEEGEISVSNPVAVVVVVLDEFCGTTLWNADHQIDAIRYPNFAALANDATWYRNASSVFPRTEFAVPAILTGKYPRGSGRDIKPVNGPNLFSILLASQIYDLTAFEPFTRLFTEEEDKRLISRRGVWEQTWLLVRDLSVVYLHTLYPVDLRMSLPRIPRQWYRVADASEALRERRKGLIRYPWNARRDDQFAHFLDCLTPSEKPTLFFCHTVLPHSPWCYLPSGRKHTEDDGQLERLHGTYGEEYEWWENDELAVAQGYQRYLLQVAFVDRLLGRLIARLKDTGLYDNCLLIVTGDHGVAFLPGQSRRAPTDANLPEIMSIPLFIKLPQQQQAIISDRNVESIDVLPTIMDLLGLKPSLETDGQSLLDPSRPERPQKVYHTGRKQISVDAAFESKLTTVDRMLGIFGSGATPDGLFRIGPHNELISHRVDEFDVSDSSGVGIRIKRGLIPQDGNPEGLVPCLIEGLVITDERTKLPVELAIAVDGTIRAVTRTYVLQEISKTWAAMIPEESLGQGDNSVEVFLVSFERDKISLQRPLEVTPPVSTQDQ